MINTAVSRKQVTLVENVIDPDTWELVEVDDVRDFLMTRFPVFPPTAKIYHGSVDAPNDVTPCDESGIERLGQMTGPFFVIIYPETGVEEGVWIAVAALLAAIVVIATMPKPSVPTSANQNTPSPNNDLASRQNTARPFQRIPDIYGTVRSTPDLLMLPYSEYIDKIEYEHAFMCIGRGIFDILDCRDDTTPIASIDGAGVTVFGPGDSPNVILPAVIPPRVVFGNGHIAPVTNVARCTAVNGQDLLTDSESVEIGTPTTMTFTMSTVTGLGTIVFTGGEDLSSFAAGDQIYLFFTGYKTHHTTHDINLTGSYTIQSINATTIVLYDVQTVANDWGWIAWTGEYGIYTSYVVAQLALAVGPFFLPEPDQAEIWLNLIATSGMYALDNSGNASSVGAGIRAVIQPTDVLGNPTTASYTRDFAFVGDATKVTVAYTWKITLEAVGPCTVTAYRTTVSPVSAQVSDGIKWKDLLSLTPVTTIGYGNVTTCYSITKATAGALSVKERKLNMLVQRKIPAYLGGGTFGDLTGSNSFADILCAAAVDPYIGNRSQSELDVDGFYATAAAITAYFGTPLASEFCYTFDSNNMSFEQMVTTIVTTVFSVAYRQGNLLRVAFEGKTDNSLMLFGHRNKLPNSETRSVAFGPTNNYDCVQLDYVSPVDESQVTLYVPDEGVNPNKLTAAGTRNYPQAYFQAWRAWNKLYYQNTATTFTALQEASLLKINDRIRVADNTRSNAQDGEVVSQNVLQLQLSQPVVFAPGKSYTIFLQGVEESVDSIAINPGANAYHVLLARAPIVTLSLDENASVRALYWIVPNDDDRPQAFLVTERESGDTSFTQKVSAINYDDRYYLNDTAVIDNTLPIGPDGSTIT